MPYYCSMSAPLFFNQSELALIQSDAFFKTKQHIYDNIIAQYNILSADIEALKSDYLNLFSAASHPEGGKISKGENYMGCPYLVLDNPRCYKEDYILACRTMFLWSHYFVATFIYKQSEAVHHRFFTRFTASKQNANQYILFTNKLWQHHVTSENYLPLENAAAEWTNDKIPVDLIKIVMVIPFDCQVPLRHLTSSFYKRCFEAATTQ